MNEDYLENDIRNLCRYILVQKLRALSWRVSHGYILADRYAALPKGASSERSLLLQFFAKYFYLYNINSLV